MSQPEATLEVESDTFEPFNRKVFWLNDQLDVYVLEPVARGWELVLPRRVKTSVSNFFTNLRFPIETLNDLLQGKVVYAASDVGRFVVNTTVGIAGFFDPATSLGLERHNEDFGQTLAWWGLGPGPYLVLPILGPSGIRDGAGLIADAAASVTPLFVSTYVTLGATAVDGVSLRARYLDSIRQGKDASLDYYVFVRNAYLQRRVALVNDEGPASPQRQEQLYYPEALRVSSTPARPRGESP